MSSIAPKALTEFAREFDGRFQELLSAAAGAPARLVEAVRYAALAPGKRLRPYLVVECCRLCGGNVECAWRPAAAVECVHAFSLVHDDLPAMDNDDLRRGRPTVHRKYDEATAILAGDALVILAFELLSGPLPPPSQTARLIRELAGAAGWGGMIGGQVLDLEGERLEANIRLVDDIHGRKTAALLSASCRIGAVVAGADEGRVDSLGRFGRDLGLAFQMVDDLLDLTADPALAGKRLGKDDLAGKQTYPRCVGLERSRALVKERAASAQEELAGFDSEADPLREVVAFVTSRNY